MVQRARRNGATTGRGQVGAHCPGPAGMRPAVSLRAWSQRWAGQGVESRLRGGAMVGLGAGDTEESLEGRSTLGLGHCNPAVRGLGADPAGRGPGRAGTATPLRTLAALTSARSGLQQPVGAQGGATWQWEGLEPSCPTPTPSPLAAPTAPAVSLGPVCSLEHRAQTPPGPLPSVHPTTAPRFSQRPP